MNMPKHHRDRITIIAEEALRIFSEVSKTAESRLAKKSPSHESSPFVNPNPPEQAINNLQRIVGTDIENYRTLVREPAIARVMVSDDGENQETYYICRTTPVSVGDEMKLASYRSPVGRLAALPVGEEYILPLPEGSRTVEVLERARFQPEIVSQEWDASHSVVEGSEYGPITIRSLRALLKESGGDIDDALLDRLLSEETETENVRDGLRRSIITKMDLRDQPILDQYQDEIFRLPLGSRLLILGAPGTGKTTTLIRRLGQKLDMNYLDEDEQRAIQSGTFGEKDDHAQSWIMFTPTELLRLYVKEAFNREGVPAPDDRIITWADCRDDLARSGFGILRSATSSSSFVMKDSALTIEPRTATDQIAWFSDFDQWQKTVFRDEIYSSAQILSADSDSDSGVAKIGRRILGILDASGASLEPGVFTSLMTAVKDVQDRVKDMRESTDNQIRGALNIQVNRNRQFLDEMATFIEGLSELNDDSDDQDVDEEDVNQARTGRRAAMACYMSAVRAHARAKARKRNVAKTSRNGRLIEWLGARVPGEQDLRDMGEILLIQSALRVVANPVRRYIDRIPGRYRRFRRTRQAEQRWYRVEGFNPSDIHPLEVDLIILAMLRGINGLITGARRLRNPGNPAHSTLERLQQRYKTQVLVDEATDFSPVQLACMFTLAGPRTRSFFACGDFNQRVTNWGTRSVEEMKWAVPKIDTRIVSIAYRQSSLLHDLAKRIADLAEADLTDVVLPSSYVDNDGVAPVLVKNIYGLKKVTDWLAHRIVEIEHLVKVLPSIAVLVNREDDVHPIAKALGDALADQNVKVIPCSGGRVQGKDSAVRVFNVQHIKGLEFEAVFFVGVDRLATTQPDLFDKYLYVGATRAATYLGWTCERELPASMVELEDRFVSDWQYTGAMR